VVFNLAPPSTNSSAAFVSEQLALIAPRISLAESNGLMESVSPCLPQYYFLSFSITRALIAYGLQAVVYGFDESHADHVPAIGALFGALKKCWPQLRTTATLNFPVEPELYHVLDIWTVEYWNFDDVDCDICGSQRASRYLSFGVPRSAGYTVPPTR
jgi:hypothetical protein